MQKKLLLDYLSERRVAVANYEDAALLHQALCEAAPNFYVQLLGDRATELSHKRVMLLNYLRMGQEVERQRVLSMLYALPVREALSIVEVIREQRINRSRARELVLAFLVGHEQFPGMAATSKQRIVRLIKHALGERTWSTVKSMLGAPTQEGEAFLRRELLRYAWNGDSARAREALAFLAGIAIQPQEPLLAKSVAARSDLQQGEGLPEQTLLGLRGIYHKKVPLRETRRLAARQVRETHRDGALTALYREGFTRQFKTQSTVQEAAPGDVAVASEQGEESARENLLSVLYKAVTGLFKTTSVVEKQAVQQEEMNGTTQEGVSTFKIEIGEEIMQEFEKLPRIQGRLAVVLDLSLSMMASGERLYHPAALGLALTQLLQECISDLHVYQVGGEWNYERHQLPVLQGASDIATALIRAAGEEPQAILVITDGYENIREGDAELAVQGIRQLGMTMPIYQVVPVFTVAENIEQRQLGPSIAVTTLAHENDVRELLALSFLACAGDELSTEEIGQLERLLLTR